MLTMIMVDDSRRRETRKRDADDSRDGVAGKTIG